jgi:hypothetical protein
MQSMQSMHSTRFYSSERPLTSRNGAGDALHADAAARMLGPFGRGPVTVNPLVASLSKNQMLGLLANEEWFRANPKAFTSNQTQFQTDRAPPLVQGVPVALPTQVGGTYLRKRSVEHPVYETTAAQWGPLITTRLPSQEISVGIDTRHEMKESWKRRKGTTTSGKRGFTTLGAFRKL